jgi:predicted HTH domain antitoxin
MSSEPRYLYLMGKKLVVNLPEQVDLDESDVLMLLAAHLYADGRLSLGQAADIARVAKDVFVSNLGRFKVSLFNAPVEDILRDMRNA